VGRDEYDFGQIANAIMVENYPGVDPMPGFDLAMKIHDQLENNGIKVEEHEVLSVWPGITPENRVDWRIAYKDGEDRAKSIIYALGARHRELNIDTTNAPIHYCALCDGNFYKNKTVAVIGGGDVAFTQAEYLSKICKKVIIVMCDENITAAPSTFERVKKNENIKIVYNYPVENIDFNGYSNCWSLCNGVNSIGVDGIFVAIGMMPNTQSIIMTSPTVTDTLGYITTDENCKTACNGFFAAGDVRAKAVRQSITAAADGAIAINSAINYLKGLI
jgi:thioredoxin reductase (NADPH)